MAGLINLPETSFTYLSQFFKIVFIPVLRRRVLQTVHPYCLLLHHPLLVPLRWLCLFRLYRLVLVQIGEIDIDEVRGQVLKVLLKM